MTRFKKITNTIAVVIVAFCSFYPLVFWGFHPELTYMQIMIKFWPLYAIFMTIYFVYVFILEKRK